MFSLGSPQTQKFLDNYFSVSFYYSRSSNKKRDLNISLCMSIVYCPYLWSWAGYLLSEFLLLQSLRSLRDPLKMLATVLNLTRWVTAAQGHVTVCSVSLRITDQSFIVIGIISLISCLLGCSFDSVFSITGFQCSNVVTGENSFWPLE